MNIGSGWENLDFDFENDSEVSCFLCNDYFDVCLDPQPFLQHLLRKHNFLIEAPEELADFRQYVLYWDKLRYAAIEDFCIIVTTNSEPGAKDQSETFYILCDKLPEDCHLRNKIWDLKIKYLTQKKEEECRNKSFSRRCIYCQKENEGGIANSFHHLSFDHGFSLGNPDNIVFGAKLLDILEQKLRGLQCLYCEKTFKNHLILREHMRKKQHKSLNPKNKIYDKFYILNYLKPGTPWEEAKKVIHGESELAVGENGSEEESLWTDWREEAGGISATCLFCVFTTTNVPTGLLCHMNDYHVFNFADLTKTLNFYSKIKLVNYIRTKVMNNECFGCSDQFSSNDELLRHIRSRSHSHIPDTNCWNQSQFLLPVMENDGLLLCLDDGFVLNEEPLSDHTASNEKMVLPEEIEPVSSNSVLNNLELREELAEERGFYYQCFFCRVSKRGMSGRAMCISHMNVMHSFDINSLQKLSSHLREVICYIRYMTQAGRCFVCQKVFAVQSDLEEHRLLEEHCSLPPSFDLSTDESYISSSILKKDGFLLDGLLEMKAEDEPP